MSGDSGYIHTNLGQDLVRALRDATHSFPAFNIQSRDPAQVAKQLIEKSVEQLALDYAVQRDSLQINSIEERDELTNKIERLKQLNVKTFGKRFLDARIGGGSFLVMVGDAGFAAKKFQDIGTDAGRIMLSQTNLEVLAALSQTAGSIAMTMGFSYFCAQKFLDMKLSIAKPFNENAQFSNVLHRVNLALCEKWMALGSLFKAVSGSPIYFVDFATRVGAGVAQYVGIAKASDLPRHRNGGAQPISAGQAFIRLPREVFNMTVQAKKNLFLAVDDMGKVWGNKTLSKDELDKIAKTANTVKPLYDKVDAKTGQRLTGNYNIGMAFATASPGFWLFWKNLEAGDTGKAIFAGCIAGGYVVTNLAGKLHNAEAITDEGSLQDFAETIFDSAQRFYFPKGAGSLDSQQAQRALQKLGRYLKGMAENPMFPREAQVILFNKVLNIANDRIGNSKDIQLRAQMVVGYKAEPA